MLDLGRHLQAAWLARGPVARVLWPLSLLYRALWGLRQLLYRHGLRRSWHAPVPVIVVGNVVAGGAGKTPVTLALLAHLKQRGWNPGVVSRGHGRKTRDVRPALPDSDASDVGDEPLLMARRRIAPVYVGRQRAAAVRALISAHPAVDIVVCDDGMQHLALARDLEILVTDERLAGNGWLLPAGPLREPWPRRADLWLHGGSATLPGAFTIQRRLAAGAYQADGSRCDLSVLRGQSVHAVAGIATPERFFDALRAEGVTLASAHGLPDHHAFDDPAQAASWGTPLVCTEKDAVKLWRHRPDAWAVPLELAWPAEFVAALDTRLAGLRDAALSSRHGHETA